MGEIADMMLDGTLCQGCGEFIDDGNAPAGIPQYCAGCARPAPMHYTTPKARRQMANRQDVIDVRKPFKCQTCDRRFRVASAVAQHARDVHP